MQKPFAITLDIGTSLANRTGSWRIERPVYVDLLPPCNHTCPAGENIQAWLYRAEEGDYEAAWRTLTEDNPFPAVEGRVCYHPCESACNRGELDEAVNIHAVERFLGDLAIKKGWTIEAGKPTGKKVLVIGAGPSGLSAAYHLRRMGHEVTIHDAGPMAGGMMRFGIPKYRLPRDILDGEIARILDMGVTLELDSPVTDIPGMMKGGGFDAAFVAIGAHLAKRTDIPAREASKIFDAVALLRGMETDEEPPMLGRRVVIYGGGDTALDVARTAKRLGASEALVVYRRTREQMPAHDVELEEALDEGVILHWLRTIKQIDGTTFTVEKMALDENGWPRPTGEFETLEADSLVLALGQEVDTSFLKTIPGVTITDDGVIDVDATMMTGYEGLFAGGDMVPAERTVTVAVGHGKKAARHIDSWLRGERYEKRTRPTVAPQPDPAADDLRGNPRRARRDQRAVRGAALPVLRQLLRVRQLLRGVPRQRRDQAGPRQALRVQLRFLQGLRPVRHRMPVRRHRHGARDVLTGGRRRDLILRDGCCAASSA